MTITYTGEYTQAQCIVLPPTTTSSLSPSYPGNVAGQLMTAWINVTDQSDIPSPPTVTAPAGWTLIIDNGSFGLGNRRAVYYKLGDGSSGTMTWGFDKPVRGNINIVVHDAVNTSSPIKDSSFRNNGSTSSPTANAVDTTGTRDCMLVCAWFEAGTCISFSTADFAETIVNIVGTTGSPERPTLIADGIQAAAGSSGTKTATSYCLGSVHVSQTQAIMIAIAPAPNPSTPAVLYPNGGESLTAGATATLNCTPATSATVAQSSLQYEYSYSTNYGSSWTVIGLSSAGVTTKSWTVPAVVGAGNLIRVRAYDGSLYSLAYDQSDSAFSIVAETAPAKPVITSPTTGSIQIRSAALAIAWIHQGGAGNPQTKYTLQWSRDNFASHTATIGPVTSSAQTATIDVSGETDGATISVRVKTTGVTLDSPYSATTSFIIASAPATPVITSPTAGSPPTTPTPSIVFTEASTFVARKMRVEKTSIEVYNSGEVAGNATSFTSGYPFANGVAVTFFLSVKNSYGLWSAEASETVTPVYSGPAKPTAVYTEVPAAGYVLIQITNSDTPSYDEVWRYLSGTNRSTAIRITPPLPVNGSYADNSPLSEQGYIYFVRAYASNGLFTDSDDSDEQSIALTNLFLHAVSRTNTNSNVLGTAASLLNLIPSAHSYNEVTAKVDVAGRSAPGIVCGQATWERLAVATFIRYTSTQTLDNLLAIWRAQKPTTSAVLLVRDSLGNRIFGKMSKPQVRAASEGYTVTFEIEQADYTEPI